MEDSILNKYLDEIGREQLLSEEQEARLSARILQGDERALNRLIEANLRFVVVIARQYQGRTALTIINGTRRAAAWKANRYVELTQGNSNASGLNDAQGIKN